MKISETLLPEFDQEMANTRKMLERVPDGKFTWKPHDKSMTLGGLAQHVAQLPGWATFTIQSDFLDLATTPRPKPVETSKELLDTFENNRSEGRAAIEGASDESLLQVWTLKVGEQILLQMPRIAVLRGVVFNHGIHHRGQLSVYLRLNNIPVPGMYGPSADEGN